MSIMNIVDIAQIASALAAVGSFVGSIIVYKRSVNRECKLETLRKLTELRMKYPSMEEISNNDKLDYIKELEFFATGINQKIYDIKIVTKMSGSRLISQYEIAFEEIVKQIRNGKEDSTAYIEYEQMIEQLRKLKKK